MKKLTVLILFISVSLSGFAQPKINQKEVERIIKTLSSDDMLGRKTFTPGIEKASLFIQSEFEKSELKPLSGLTNFEQKFNMFSLKPIESAILLNDSLVNPENYFIVTSQESIVWNEFTGAEIFYINEKANLWQSYNDIKKKNVDAIVLVNQKHQKMFSNFKKYFGSGSLFQELGKEKSQVFILADSVQVNFIKIKLVNQVETKSLANVAGMIPGKRENEFVVFSAHYDHLGYIRPVDGDSIANGADDDASGSTAVISLADYYSKQNKPERTLIFVCFTAEEMGGFGSQYFSKQINPDQVVAMFNIEMIGKPSKFGPSSAFITGFDKSDFGKILQKAVKKSANKFYPDPYPDQNLFYRSDNATLARLGVPAHSISSDQIDKDKLYHSVDDEFNSLNMTHMTNMIKAIAVGSKSIVDGKETPKRVEKSSVE